MSLRRIYSIKIIMQIFSSLLLVGFTVVQVIRYRSAIKIDFEVVSVAHQQKALSEKVTFLIDQILHSQNPELKEKLQRGLLTSVSQIERNHKLLTGVEPFLNGQRYEVPVDMQKPFFGESGVHPFTTELVAKSRLLASNMASGADLDWLSSKETDAAPVKFNSLISLLESSSEASQIRFLMITVILCVVFATMATGLNILFSRWSYRSADERINALELKCKTLEIDNSSAHERDGLIQLGQITGGLIHEIKNPLAVISNMTEFCLHKLKTGPIEPEKLVQTFTSILKMSTRINDTLNAFRTVVQNVSNTNSLESTSSKTLLSETYELTKDEAAGKGIPLEFKFPATDLFVSCNPVDIHQVLKILIQNSLESVVNHKSPWVRVDVQDSTDGVQYSVTDSGEGIPVANRANIFKPFYTTKSAATPGIATNSGFGLGLNLAERILKAHGGKIWLDENHSNTRFIFMLNKAAAPDAQSKLKVVG